MNNDISSDSVAIAKLKTKFIDEFYSVNQDNIDNQLTKLQSENYSDSSMRKVEQYLTSRDQLRKYSINQFLEVFHKKLKEGKTYNVKPHSIYEYNKDGDSWVNISNINSKIKLLEDYIVHSWFKFPYNISFYEENESLAKTYLLNDEQKNFLNRSAIIQFFYLKDFFNGIKHLELEDVSSQQDSFIKESFPKLRMQGIEITMMEGLLSTLDTEIDKSEIFTLDEINEIKNANIKMHYVDEQKKNIYRILKWKMGKMLLKKCRNIEDDNEFEVIFSFVLNFISKKNNRLEVHRDCVEILDDLLVRLLTMKNESDRALFMLNYQEGAYQITSDDNIFLNTPLNAVMDKVLTKVTLVNNEKTIHDLVESEDEILYTKTLRFKFNDKDYFINSKRSSISINTNQLSYDTESTDKPNEPLFVKVVIKTKKKITMPNVEILSLMNEIFEEASHKSELEKKAKLFIRELELREELSKNQTNNVLKRAKV